MDLLKLKKDDIKEFKLEALRATTKDIQKRLAELRLNISLPLALKSKETKSLKKSLARVLTFETQKKKAAVKTSNASSKGN